MTFFHDLNKRLAALAQKQDLQESRVAESEKWIQKAVNPAHKGDLHKALHVAQGEKIPKAKIDKATHSKNPKLRHMAQFAKNVAMEGTCSSCGCSPCECVEEGNAFTGALAKTPKGGKFKVGGKEFTDTSSLEEKKEPKSKGTAFDPETAKKMFANKDEHPRHDVHDTGYSKRYTRKHEDDMEKDDEVKSDEPKKKGRPKGPAKGPERVTKHAYKHKGERKVKEGDMEGSHDHDEAGEFGAEGDYVKTELHTMIRVARDLEMHLRDNEDLPTWCIGKLSQAKGMLVNVMDYIMSEKERGIEAATGKEGISIAEKITKNTPTGDVIHDFVHSKNPKFAGKTKKERINQALGATYAMKKGKMEEAGKPDFLDLDKDGDKKESMKKAAKDKKDKEEKVDETTVAGSVATATTSGKSSKGGISFGKGVYESLNNSVEQMITESVKVESNMEECGDMGQGPSVTVQADGEDAAKLLMLLKLAGLGNELEENKLDWPTDPTVTGGDDPHMRRLSGGLNGPKSTGQSTMVGGGIPNYQTRRQSTMEESVELERSLFKTWKNYKG